MLRPIINSSLEDKLWLPFELDWHCPFYILHL